MVHAAESLHWYDRAGKPAYTVAAKDGFQRPTTLRDARKLGLVPSVTTILKCAAAPQLENWKREQMLMSALTLPRLDGEPEKDWIARVWTDSGETARKASERGTAIHAAIQGAYEGKSVSPEFYNHVGGAERAVADWMKGPWRAEQSFACSLGFGGKVDLSHQWAVLDFKSKEFGPDEDLKTWENHAMQLAAYRHGLGIEKARCAICYVSVTHPGLSRLIEIPEEELQRGWEMFKALLAFWIAKNKYNPAFTLEKQAA